MVIKTLQSALQYKLKSLYIWNKRITKERGGHGYAKEVGGRDDGGTETKGGEMLLCHVMME